MSGGGIGLSGGHHAIGARINPGYYAVAERAISDEVKERDLALDGEDEMPKSEPCNCVVHVLLTVLILTIVFWVVWELT